MGETQTGEYIVATSVKNPERVERRRAEIIEAAEKIFSVKGYDAATTKEIADAAGMNVATMFQYVKTKQDILYLVCSHIHSLIEQALCDVVPEDSNPMKTIEKNVSALYKIFDEASDYVVLLYQEIASLEKAARCSILSREKRLCNHLEEQLKIGIEAGFFKIDTKTASLIAEDIIVQAQMWAFRRWSLSKKFSLEEYTATRIKLLKTLLKTNHT